MYKHMLHAYTRILVNMVLHVNHTTRMINEKETLDLCRTHMNNTTQHNCTFYFTQQRMCLVNRN